MARCDTVAVDSKGWPTRRLADWWRLCGLRTSQRIFTFWNQRTSESKILQMDVMKLQQNDKEAVLLAEELLESLKDAVPLRLPPYLHYLERHRSAALGFWFAPVIILHLIKELKEDLKNVLADNYFEDSVEYTDLFVKASMHHKMMTTRKRKGCSMHGAAINRG
ncbi:unnamed protein product [Cuscuta europaea]|uniref:Uncharacterized protein n=1 Tax=Cuscuta europaea TaxID=41803 RepID=A0A9P0YK91_CUSEU|nr:unnamed protein product [Cuscuta europaea]